LFIDTSFLDVSDCILLGENALNSHNVLGKGTCFIGTYVISTTHGFTSLQISDQVVLVFHFSDTVCQSDGDGQWETFWNSDDNDADCDNEGFDELMDSVQCEQCTHHITGSESSVQDVTQHTDECSSC
jgi:hypothetical protein